MIPPNTNRLAQSLENVRRPQIVCHCVEIPLRTFFAVFITQLLLSSIRQSSCTVWHQREQLHQELLAINCWERHMGHVPV